MPQIVKKCDVCIFGVLLGVLVMLLLPAGCIVQPPPTAASEAVTAYNTLIIGLYGLIATAVAGILTQVIAIVIGNRNARRNQEVAENSAKKSAEAIEAADHQNQKLMTITEKLMKTDEKSNETDRDIKDLQNAPAAVPVAPQVVVVQIPAAQAAPAAAMPTQVGTVDAAKPNVDMKADALNVRTEGPVTVVNDAKP